VQSHNIDHNLVDLVETDPVEHIVVVLVGLEGILVVVGVHIALVGCWIARIEEVFVVEIAVLELADPDMLVVLEEGIDLEVDLEADLVEEDIGKAVFVVQIVVLEEDIDLEADLEADLVEEEIVVDQVDLEEHIVDLVV